MRSPRTAVLVTAFVFAAAPVALAQTTPAPATEQKSDTSARPITLFPAEARFAFIDFQRVAATSESGKIAARLLKEFGDKKLAELDARDRQLQALAAKRDTGVASGPAAAQMARDVARLQREAAFARENAQAEFQQLRNDADTELQMKVVPIVAEIAKERNLHAVFTTEASLLYVLPALDISDEVVQRLDLQAKKIK